MQVEVKLSGVDGVLDMLNSLPPEVVSKRGGPVKSALRKGALVILKAEKANLQAAIANGAERSATTGLLLKNLIASRGKAPSGGKGERYLVRVKKRVYARTGGKPVTTLLSAQLLEYGSSQQPAEPFIRPAVESRGGLAISTITQELVKGIDRVVKKLAKGR